MGRNTLVIDPVHFYDPEDDMTGEFDKPGKGWYFWQETWSDRYGPYETEADANTALTKYIETELR